MAYLNNLGPGNLSFYCFECKESTSGRKSRQIRVHSSTNQGVNLRPPGLEISPLSASGLIQHQSLISAASTRGVCVQRPMKTEQSSFSAPVLSNCAWY